MAASARAFYWSYRISSNKRSRRLFNLEALTRRLKEGGAYF